MADVVDFRTGRRSGTQGAAGDGAKLLGVLTQYAAVVAQQRAMLEELLANLMAQRQAELEEQRPQDRLLGPIWRPERPLPAKTRDQLRDGWRHGLMQAVAAEHLFLASRNLANLSRYRDNDPAGKDRGVEGLAYGAWQDEIWRQFHVAPFDVHALKWKRRQLAWVRNQDAGRAIIAADAAWLERRNGVMNRYRKAEG